VPPPPAMALFNATMFDGRCVAFAVHAGGLIVQVRAACHCPPLAHAPRPTHSPSQPLPRHARSLTTPRNAMARETPHSGLVIDHYQLHAWLPYPKGRRCRELQGLEYNRVATRYNAVGWQRTTFYKEGVWVSTRGAGWIRGNKGR
jgi:hypothetical protein